MKTIASVLATAALTLALTPAFAQNSPEPELQETLPKLEKVEVESLDPGVEDGAEIGKYKFVLEFQPAETREQSLIRTALQGEPGLAQILETLSDHIALPQDVPVRFKNCGAANAFWSPPDQDISMCYELLTELNVSYQERENLYYHALSWADQMEVLLGTTIFVMLHEIGHGMVDLFDLPITGREEDTVDQFATFLLINADEEGQPIEERPSRLALLGATFFEDLFPVGTAANARIWADVHSFGAQRSIDIMCLLLGSNPRDYAEILVPGLIMVNDFMNEYPEIIGGNATEWLAKTDDLNLIPFRRIFKCSHEYARYSGSWKYLVETFMQPKAD